MTIICKSQKCQSGLIGINPRIVEQYDNVCMARARIRQLLNHDVHVHGYCFMSKWDDGSASLLIYHPKHMLPPVQIG